MQATSGFDAGLASCPCGVSHMSGSVKLGLGSIFRLREIAIWKADNMRLVSIHDKQEQCLNRVNGRHKACQTASQRHTSDV
jgi:hypothetical protein